MGWINYEQVWTYIGIKKERTICPTNPYTVSPLQFNHPDLASMHMYLYQILLFWTSKFPNGHILIFRGGQKKVLCSALGKKRVIKYFLLLWYPKTSTRKQAGAHFGTQEREAAVWRPLNLGLKTWFFTVKTDILLPESMLIDSASLRG